MIHFLAKSQHPHSGMTTFAEGLKQIAADLVNVSSSSASDELQPMPGDWVIFDDEIGLAERASMKEWGRCVRCALLLHSPLLQMDLCNELQTTLTNIRREDIDLVLCADRETAEIIDNLVHGVRAEWLPHCMPDLSGYAERYSMKRPAGHPFKCWMPMTLPDSDSYYQHKNTFCQIAAVAQANATLGCSIEVETNYASDLLRQFAVDLNVFLKVRGSQTRDAHLDSLAKVDIGLCVSLTESFSYNAAELMLNGTPTLFGPGMRWPWENHNLVECCGIIAPGSSIEVSTKLERLLQSPDHYETARTLGSNVASRVIDFNHKKVRQRLNQIASNSIL